MAKDYFQDIVPPSDDQPIRRSGSGRSIKIKQQETESEPEVTNENETEAHTIDEHEDSFEEIPAEEAPRSIRNIAAPQRQARRSAAAMADVRDMPPPLSGIAPRPRRSGTTPFLWGFVVVCLCIIAGLGFFLLRKTTITVTPLSHTVVFDQASIFSATPAAEGAVGLTYSVYSKDFDDSAPVTSSGVTHVERKATGSITVYNNYSTAPVRLVKNTRFASASGLIFRVPADISIPGKTGSNPGSVTVTVVADQVGDNYNVAAGKFTVPGLQSNATEYAAVYAQSSSAFTGGFSGNEPSVDDAVKQAALADIRGRIESKIRTDIEAQLKGNMIIFPDLVHIEYADATVSTESDGTVKVREASHVTAPQFPADTFGQTIAQKVSADATSAKVSIRPGAGYAAHFADATSTALGTDPISFSLTGSATIVWDIDAPALTKALAGRDKSAFQTIIAGFPGIKTAKARIEPFWKSTFPSDPNSIAIKINPPENAN